jgi:hypothetical protein
MRGPSIQTTRTSQCGRRQAAEIGLRLAELRLLRCAAEGDDDAGQITHLGDALDDAVEHAGVAHLAVERRQQQADVLMRAWCSSLRSRLLR